MLSFVSAKDENSHGDTKGSVGEKTEILMERTLSGSRDENLAHLEVDYCLFFRIVVEVTILLFILFRGKGSSYC